MGKADPQTQFSSFSLFTMSNDPGRKVFLVFKKLEPDSLGKIPVWDFHESRWRCVNKRWLIRYNKPATTA